MQKGARKTGLILIEKIRTHFTLKGKVKHNIITFQFPQKRQNWEEGENEHYHWVSSLGQ